MLPMLLAWLIVARIERRRLSVYFLAGKRTISRFLLGSAGGFVALSVLVALLFFGHWLQIAPASLPVAAAIEDALLWAIVFLMVGVFEEGAFRCYLLYTLARSFGHSPRGFWIAALLSSAIFGVIHFGNTGESQIGILSAAAIGFVFCVSVRLTGTVWWAFGFHFAWDWAETYFYGTSDSGLIPRGSLYLSTPVGSPLWSGGVTGPEGSPLVIPVVLATLLLVIAVYGPGQRSSSTAIPGEPGQTPGQIPGIGPG
jgi:membrane protease YdiL (CAAX protease family)